MHLSYIRPVGEKVSLKSAGFKIRSDYQFIGFQSGTMALQAALETAVDKQADRECNMTAIIPAYACPDLVSACDGAQIKAKLIDTRPDFPLPSIEQLRAAVDDTTVAVVLPAFLGIKPDPKLVNEAKALGLFVICDFAQSPFALTPDTSEHADCYVYSFGKGKPVSLLGGGALLLSREYDYSRSLELSRETSQDRSQDHPPESAFSELKLRLKIAAYNFVITRIGYAILMTAFGSRIGKTVYKEPQPVRGLDRLRESLISSNIECQQSALHEKRLATVRKLDAIVSRSPCLSELNTADDKTKAELLRYPALCQTEEQRDKLIRVLNSLGVGATAMYATALSDIESVPAYVKAQDAMPNARRFAEQLLTLPCHSGMNEKALKLVEHALQQYKELA